MAPTARIIAIDGAEYRVQFWGFGHSLEAMSPDGSTTRLEPWTLGAHLEALRSCLYSRVEGLALDRSAFIQAVLRRSGNPVHLAPRFGPLALWWAAGGNPAPMPNAMSVTESDLGSVKARLRAWTHGERSRALSAVLADENGLTFDVVGYLEAMLRACVVQLDPATDLLELDSASTARLISGVIALNAPTPEDTDTVLRGIGDSEQMARATLRLCQALGWTPSQVWAAPAAEIDRLLALLDRTEGRPRQARPGRPRRIADMPDAVVIRVEDG